MPERSSKRKARRDSVSSSLGEPEAASQRTENVPSISDRDFSEISEKIKKSVGRRIKDAETGQREILKMIENLSSKIDSLSGHPLRSENPIDLYEPENQASTSRPTTLNELHPSQGQHNWFIRSCRKTYFCRNLLRNSAHFCKDPADMYGSSRFSATIFAEACRSAQIRKDRKPVFCLPIECHASNSIMMKMKFPGNISSTVAQ